MLTVENISVCSIKIGKKFIVMFFLQVFGDTKCYFIQNVKKKKNKQSKRKNGSVKSEVPDADGMEISQKAESTVSSKIDANPVEKEENNNNKKVKKVCFMEEVNIISEPKTEKDHSEDGNQDRHVTVQNDSKVQKIGNDHDAANKQVENGVEVENSVDVGNGTEVGNGVAETNEVSLHKCDVNDEREKTELSASCVGLESASSVGLETDKPLGEVEQKEDALGDENKDKSLKNENQTSQQPENNIGVPKSVKNAPMKLPASLLKNSRTQGLRNPAVEFSKQYYPSGHLSHKKQRTSSESVESSNRQSIYQHFMMTKRQLSLDSALSSENNQATPTKSIEFPFPVHSINEHKIKAGMKLGLYDQKALEKIEKTRKLHKSKLPSLSYD